MEFKETNLKKFLLNKEEKKIYFRLKLKSILDKSYMVSLREYLKSKNINEYLYSDD